MLTSISRTCISILFFSFVCLICRLVVVGEEIIIVIVIKQKKKKKKKEKKKKKKKKKTGRRMWDDMVPVMYCKLTRLSSLLVIFQSYTRALDFSYRRCSYFQVTNWHQSRHYQRSWPTYL